MIPIPHWDEHITSQKLKTNDLVDALDSQCSSH